MSDHPPVPVESLKKTALHAAHVALGGKMVEFGGWHMPVAYGTGILTEHRAVRNAAGVFDISHMGQFFARGPGARAWLNSVFSNQLEKIGRGQSQYGFLLNDRGGVIDDLIIYQYGAEDFLLVVNASMIDEDLAWLQKNLPAGTEGVKLENMSDDCAALALQGPRAAEIFAAFFGSGVEAPPRLGVKLIDRAGVPFYVARTGYTGEDGFEFFYPAANAEPVLRELLKVGEPFGLIPAGLGARDSLRLEVCYPLNGNDLSPDRTPLEAGLGIFCALDKEFIGVGPLRAQKTEGVKQRLAAIKMTEKGPPPRPHYPVWANGVVVGELCSGGLSPCLESGIGLAYLPIDLAKAGQPVEIEIRGRKYAAQVEKKPMYKKTD